VVEVWEESFDLQEELSAAEGFSPAAWFAERREEEDEYVLDDSQMEIHPRGTGPMTQLTVGYDHKNKPHAEIFIATLPTGDPAAIPVHLRFGDWNSCPSAHVHMALARWWGGRFGAQIATVSCDIVEYTVERPPSSDAEAMELAWEQYLYCVDIVDQGVGSVATLAQALRHSTKWYFGGTDDGGNHQARNCLPSADGEEFWGLVGPSQIERVRRKAGPRR
jgi:hypothetical protein